MFVKNSRIVFNAFTANADLTLNCRGYNKLGYPVSVYETVTVFRYIHGNLPNLIEPNEEKKVKYSIDILNRDIERFFEIFAIEQTFITRNNCLFKMPPVHKLILNYRSKKIFKTKRSLHNKQY